ncbi:MAG: flagellar hook-basal body complex protein FliE [Lachnospira sp.]
MDLTSAISSLGNDYVNKVTNAMEQSALLKSSDVSETDSSFDAIYKSVSGLLESTNSYIQRAQKAEIDFALGNMNNTHELGVYQQEANIALQYTVAIRDKALEAYNSIMNMQI